MRSVSFVSIHDTTDATRTGPPVPATQLTQATVIASVTGATSPVGTLSLQASNDEAPGFPTSSFVPTSWITVDSVSVSGNGDYSIPYTELAYQWVRVVYTRTSGSGGLLTATLDGAGPSQSGGVWLAGGDLTGSTTSQTVVGLQGLPISTTAPSTNEVLTWSGSEWAPAAGGGGSSLVPVDLDLVLGSVNLFVQDQVSDDGSLGLTLLTGAYGTGSAPSVVTNPDITGLNGFSADSILCAGDNSNGGYAYISGTNPGLAIGTGDFSFEAFVYFTDVGRAQFLLDTRATNGNVPGLYVGWCINTTNRLAFGTNGIWLESPTSINANKWHHIVVDRVSGQARIKVDGAIQYSAAFTTDLTQDALTLFAPVSRTSAFVGAYFNQIRLVVGSAVYGDQYIVPTAPLMATSLPASPSTGQQIASPGYWCLCLSGGGSPFWSKMYLG